MLYILWAEHWLSILVSTLYTFSLGAVYVGTIHSLKFVGCLSLQFTSSSTVVLMTLCALYSVTVFSDTWTAIFLR